jgi:hypothetical protein
LGANAKQLSTAEITTVSGPGRCTTAAGRTHFWITILESFCDPRLCAGRTGRSVLLQKREKLHLVARRGIFRALHPAVWKVFATAPLQDSLQQKPARRATVSLFGKLVPLTEPSMQISPEVTAILGKVLEDAGLKSPAGHLCYEQLRELHDRLDVLMFDEILTYLPARHLEAFVKMNDEKRSRGEIDKFLEENMPNAEEVFAGALAKLRERYLRMYATL